MSASGLKNSGGSALKMSGSGLQTSRHTTSRERPLWSYFGRDVLDHNRTKIERIRFLLYFVSPMSDLHLASENIEKFS